MQPIAPLTLLVVAPFTPDLVMQNPCALNSYLGNVYDAGSTQTLSVLAVTEESCIESWDTKYNSVINPGLHAQYTKAFQPSQQLVWLEKESIDVKLQSQEDASALDKFLRTLQQPFVNEDQQVISLETSSSYLCHYRTETSALISIKPALANVIDTLLPPFWKSKLLPNSPVEYIPVPDEAINPVRDVLSKFKFNPVVASVVNNISIPQIKSDIRFLTGEDNKSSIISRHSFSEGALTAADWLKARVEETGAACRLSPFLDGFAPNVICRYSSIKETNSTILISGHYDSRGSFGSTRAPGGDDDGSGTTGVLSIARTIGRKGVKFHANVELAFFAGEEQGLLGSRAYARELRAAEANLTLMIQADMTAYRAPGEPLQLGLPEKIGTPEVTELVSKISSIYSPELNVGYSPACCSDHQSFIEQGFPATQVFERAGPIADPMYHNSGDLSDREGYDFDQLFAIAKVQFATVLHTAGFELSTK